MSDTPIRLAVWCAPRTISTALMRSWGNRVDTAVCDEPLYAHYLKETGLPHPGADEILAQGETDWHAAVRVLTGPVPGGRRIFFQKHMAKHLLPGIDRGWLADLEHAFLIRDPRESLTSFHEVIPDPSLHDTGLAEQAELFVWLRERTGSIPVVVDSRDVLEDPRRVLGLWCERIGVPFDEAMLSWPPGPRETDGVWAPHWYANVERSTGFGPYRPKNRPVPDALRDVLTRCLESYEALARHRLR